MTIVGYLILIFCILSAVMMGQSVFRIVMMLYAWRHPDKLVENRAPKEYSHPQKSFTVLLPARHEEAVIQGTMQRVFDSNYPKELMEIVVICESQDYGTIAKVREKIEELESASVQLVIFDDKPVNKPHGLNKGLAATKNEIVIIFDSEDEPHPDILNVANTVFLSSDARVLQCGVQLMDYNNHWFSVLNVLEYYFWFKSSLGLFLKLGFVPLGGNTVFMYREDLEKMGGWDEQCLTEDADLAVQAWNLGLPIKIIYDDVMVTKEETPTNTSAFMRQRTRWSQGFLQIYKKGEWKRLNGFVAKVLAIYIFLFPIVQEAFTGLLPFALVMMAVVKIPVAIALYLYVPLYLLIIQSVLQVAGLYEFTRAHNLRIPVRASLLS